MANDSVKLGALCNSSDGRDAIHIAIVPVVAVCAVEPGEHVGFDGTPGSSPVGIVDPFLKGTVQTGQTFWLCLYPNTITSLRHVWTHPAFTTSDKDVSETWLRAYAMRVNCYDSPDKAFDRLLDGLRTGELFFYGSDLHGRYELDDEDELRRHGEAYLGIAIDFGRFTFSCSC